MGMECACGRCTLVLLAFDSVWRELVTDTVTLVPTWVLCDRHTHTARSDWLQKTVG